MPGHVADIHKVVPEKKSPGRRPGTVNRVRKAGRRLLLGFFRFGFWLVTSPLLERGAQDIPERRA